MRRLRRRRAIEPSDGPPAPWPFLSRADGEARGLDRLLLMGQRVYQPQTGRFLQTDPVEGGSANDYDYVNQDPVNLVDLVGESVPSPCGYAARKMLGAKRANDICRAMGGKPRPKARVRKNPSKFQKACLLAGLAASFTPGGRVVQITVRIFGVSLSLVCYKP